MSPSDGAGTSGSAVSAGNSSPAVDPALAGARITFGGLGPLTLGTSFDALRNAGWAVEHSEGACWGQSTAPKLTASGVRLFERSDSDATLGMIVVESSAFTTETGAKVGDSMAQLRQGYGEQLVMAQKATVDGPKSMPIVVSGDRELVFVGDWSDADIGKVDKILARYTSPQVVFVC